MRLIKRSFRLARSILASNFRRLDFPYQITFAVTYKCNSRCKTCNIWKKAPQNELTASEISQFFQKSNRFAYVDLTGGEVSLRPDFLEIVETILDHCKNLRVLHFATNGLHTNKIVNCVESIMKMNPPKLIITVSLDGDKELNDSIRGIPGAWEQQMATFKALRAIPGVQVVLGMTLSRYNFDKFETAFQSVKKEYGRLTYKDFHLNIAHSSGHYYDNEDLAVDEMLVDTVVEQVKKYMKARGIPLSPVAFLEREYLKRVEMYLRTGKTPLRCHALRSCCFVNPLGDVFPCGMYDIVVGNLRDYGYDLAKIWQSELCKKVQGEIWNFNCPQCWTPCQAYQAILGNILRREFPVTADGIRRLDTKVGAKQ